MTASNDNSLLLPPARPRARELGVVLGVLPPGPRNAITDVAGVRVGHATLYSGASIRTGVTAVVPAPGNLFQRKVPAAVFAGNGFGKLTGATQLREVGNLETPVLLTNTLDVPAAMEAAIEYTLDHPGNERVLSVNAIVGENNDGLLSDIRRRHVRKQHALASIRDASETFALGCVGAGAGTVCFGFKGGIGTASRVLPAKLGGYTVGVLVQTNFGGVLQIGGVPVGKMLGRLPFDDALSTRSTAGSADGSCMMVVATDAPLDGRNLYRLAKRAFMGLARTGGIAANGSGDYAIAFSTVDALRVPHAADASVQSVPLLHNDLTSPLFLGAIEATEEAIIDSLFTAVTTSGFNGNTVEALPVEKVLPMLR